MNGACSPGPNACPCSKNKDCDDSNPCTEESCIDGACQYADAEGSCDDGKDCTSGDYCDSGRCVAEQNDCTTGDQKCKHKWTCTEWGTCSNNRQTRTCTCDCPGKNCPGDHETERSCGSQVVVKGLEVSADKELRIGDVLTITIADQDGNPVSGKIILIRPDGTEITLEGNTYIVDQPGTWKVRVEREGYTPGEAETSVTEKPQPAADLGSQIANAVKEVVDFITKEPVRFALLLTTVVFVVGGVFLLKARRKKEIEKI
jgi:hypothetical protein